MSISKILINEKFVKIARQLSGYYKLGLLTDDMYAEDDPDVTEALRRLPQDLTDKRNYRIIKACQLNLAHSILPKEQWTLYECDVRYLKPYLDEVIREREEKETWESKYG